MKGKNIIDYIVNNGLQEEEIFMSCQGICGWVKNIQKMGNNPVLSDKEFEVDKSAMKSYFSNWFKIISYSQVVEYYKSKSILLLLQDGTERFIDDDYTLEELREEANNGALFALDCEESKLN